MSPTPEALARIQIDQQLTAAGWAVQDVKAINLHAQRGGAERVPIEESRHSTKKTFPTASPSKHTLGFFNQNLVTGSVARMRNRPPIHRMARRASTRRERQYPHAQAVADGVNVGYDIYRIRTQITESGSALESGFEYKKRDRLTRAERWKLQDEEETYSNRDLDRSVTSPSQIRTVIQTFRDKLFTDLFPSRYIHTSDAETYRPIAEIVEDLNVIEAEAKETDKALRKILKQLGI